MRGERKRRDRVRVGANKHRSVQVARCGGRKLFDDAAREDFLGWFAATGNVVWSAEKAGFAHQTVWKHRMADPDFAAAFDLALEQGVTRAKAKLLEMKRKAGPVGFDAGRGEEELEELSVDSALIVVREFERGRGGPAAGFGRKAGAAVRVATNAEVDAELAGALKAFAGRLKSGGCGVGLSEVGGSGGASPGSVPVTPPPPPVVPLPIRFANREAEA